MKVKSLSRVWLWEPMNYSTPGLPVHHQLLEFTQTHVHWVSNAIQPLHPLLSPSPPALNLSQHQGLFSHPERAGTRSVVSREEEDRMNLRNWGSRISRFSNSVAVGGKAEGWVKHDTWLSSLVFQSFWLQSTSEHYPAQPSTHIYEYLYTHTNEIKVSQNNTYTYFVLNP